MADKTVYFRELGQDNAKPNQPIKKAKKSNVRYIRVYDKTLTKEIATFTNEMPNEDESKKELMASPIVSIVSNGESTLSFQMLAKSQKWQDIKHPENIYECNGRYYTALNEQSITYSGEIVDVVLVETWYLLKRKFVQVHNVDTKIEAMDEHTVKILPKTKPEFKLTVNGVAYDDSQVKDSRGVVMPRGSAGYALWGLLKGTDWKLGVCDVLPDGFDATKDYGTFNVESDMKSVLENIQFVQELYGGILVWDSKNKICSLRDEKKDSDFNKWKGVSFQEGTNLSEPPTVTWDNNIITRLYPLGNGNLNIKRINNGKNYIDNFSYTDTIYEGYMQNPNIYDTNDEGGQKTLKGWGERKLAEFCKPRKSIQYQVVDMRATEEHYFEEFDVNDIVRAYYKDLNGKEVFELLRIQSISYDYFNSSADTTLEVGDKVSNENEIFMQIYKKSIYSAPSDWMGDLSGFDVNINIPDNWLEEFLSQGFKDNLNDMVQYQSEKTTENTQAIADVKSYADDNFASLELFTSYSKQTDEKFVQSDASITLLSNELQAQIELEATHYSETSKGITATSAYINQVANDLSAQIALEASHYNGVTDNIASLQLQANAQGSSITAQANQINLIADDVRVQGSLLADKAEISDLRATNINVDSLSTRVFNVENLVANKVSASEVDAKFLTATDIGTKGNGLTIGNGGETAVYGKLRCNSTIYGRLESSNGLTDTVYIIGKNNNYQIHFSKGICTGWNKA